MDLACNRDRSNERIVAAFNSNILVQFNLTIQTKNFAINIKLFLFIKKTVLFLFLKTTKNNLCFLLHD